MFTQLLETPFTLAKTDDFEAVKSTYKDLKKTLADTKAAFPTSWPQTLPNLSTFDTDPQVLSFFFSFHVIFHLKKISLALSGVALGLQSNYGHFQHLSRRSPFNCRAMGTSPSLS